MGIVVEFGKSVLKRLHFTRHLIFGIGGLDGPEVGTQDHDVKIDYPVSSDRPCTGETAEYSPPPCPPARSFSKNLSVMSLLRLVSIMSALIAHQHVRSTS